MREAIDDLVQAIHDHPARLVLVTAGAGTQALSWLLATAGASRTLLEALTPYSEASFNDFLGRQPAKYVAEATAGCLAGRAFTRARQLYPEGNPDDAPLIGLACTATIVTDRPKRGDHRAHIAVWRATQVARYTLHLAKGARDRAGEEEMVSRLILNSLAQACGLDNRLAIPLVEGDRLLTAVSDFFPVAQQLSQGAKAFFAIRADGYLDDSMPLAILSGAFNPLHKGHLALARTAEAILNQPLAFEVAAVNVDKPPLAPAIILARMGQFAGRWPVYASRAPTYLEKARLFPGATFVVGYDTAVRILQPRYYHEREEEMLAALDEIARQGNRFLVAGRKGADGRFHSIDDLAIPARFNDLFQAIAEERFRRDVSSSELRAAGKLGSR
jgi:hypothetical protein